MPFSGSLLGAAMLAFSPQEPPSPASLLPALEYLSAPCRFRLEYRTTLIRNDAPYSAPIRRFLTDQELRPGGFEEIDALISDIRASNPLTRPDKPPSQSPLYLGATTQYRIACGRTRFFQEMLEEQPSLPVVLSSPEVTLLYNRTANRIDFVDPSDNMDLRTMESMLSPLPLSSIARAHWLSKPCRSEKLDNQMLLVMDDESLSLAVKCSTEQPRLPVVCWIQERSAVGGQKRIACFISYQAIQGLLQVRAVYAVRETPEQVRVDEYVFQDLERVLGDEEIVLKVSAGAGLIDRTGGKGKSAIDVAGLPGSWAALFVVDP